MTAPRVTEQQYGLFEGRPAARRADPNSSHAAADLVHSHTNIAKSQREQCLAALKKYPGSTSKQLAQLAGLDRTMVARRLPEMEIEGDARCTGRDPEARHELIWWPPT